MCLLDTQRNTGTLLTSFAPSRSFVFWPQFNGGRTCTFVSCYFRNPAYVGVIGPMLMLLTHLYFWSLDSFPCADSELCSFSFNAMTFVREMQILQETVRQVEVCKQNTLEPYLFLAWYLRRVFIVQSKPIVVDPSQLQADAFPKDYKVSARSEDAIMQDRV